MNIDSINISKKFLTVFIEQPVFVIQVNKIMSITLVVVFSHLD